MFADDVMRDQVEILKDSLALCRMLTFETGAWRTMADLSEDGQCIFMSWRKARTWRTSMRMAWTLLSWRMYGRAVHWTLVNQDRLKCNYVQVSEQTDHLLDPPAIGCFSLAVVLRVLPFVWSVAVCHCVKTTIVWLNAINFKITVCDFVSHMSNHCVWLRVTYFKWLSAVYVVPISFHLCETLLINIVTSYRSILM